MTDSTQMADHRLRRAIVLAQKLGWKAAIAAAFDPAFADYVTNPSRLGFIDILPREPSASILEIGPGLGQMTVELSRRYARVDAIDADTHQVQFCQIRSVQEGRHNVRIFAGGEDASLPFPDSSYDGVVMNLVFEWCGIRRQHEAHETVQKRYLKEIFRVLKPGGFFYISTKNRFSIRLLLGVRDEHLFNMPFGSCLPRFVAKLLVRNRRPDGQLYSWSYLRGLLTDAGFSHADPYLAIPDPRWPSAYIRATDLRANDLASAAFTPRIRSALKITPTAFFWAISPGITFIATKQVSPPSH